MSKLEQLIKTYCPDGVEYKKIGEIAEIVRGKRFVHKDDVQEGVPAIHYGELYTHYGISAYETKTHIRNELATKMRYAHTGDVIVVGAGENKIDIGVGVAWLGKDDVAAHDACYILTNHKQNPSFLSYYFRTEEYHKQLFPYVSEGKICSFLKDALEKIEIPIPPLPVQEEIVRILDSFTELKTELETKLETEFEMRKKQYEYYRDKMLSLENYEGESTVVRIEDICNKICSGGTPNSKRADYYGGNHPWLRTQEVVFGPIDHTELCITDEGLKNSSAKYIPEYCVIVAMYGATVGRVGYNTIPLTTNQACCNLEIDPNKAEWKYVYYSLANMYEYIKSKGQGSQTNINANVVKNLEIKLPTDLKEQRHIVDILDKFSALSEDISEGLPAEIEMRHQQYEYYRDKLLSFKRLEAV